MKRLLFTLICCILCMHIVFTQGITGNLPFKLSLDQFASGFSSPVDIAHMGDSRLFVVERSGRIRVLNEDGSIQSSPFLDINDRVINTGGQSEQGLLALEFHPDYSNNGFLFVHYSDNDGNTVIARFTADPMDPNLALADSEEIIYTAEQPFTNHNGGSLKFGPDGMLYIGLGDGGAANDPQNLAQNTNSPMGKMLRLDVDNGLPYTIPADNPFINDANVLDEIWATGLRNPWKFSFDRSTGDMWIGDVGQNQWEEIDLQLSTSAGGENYGWRCKEGDHNAISSGCNGTYVPPIAEYNHLGFTHCSVTGGYVYRGASKIFQDAPPIYLYSDYCSGSFWGTYPTAESSGAYASVEMDKFSGNAISTFGEDQNGELYVAAINNGRIYKISAACNIDVNVNVNAASCTEAVDGSIDLSIEDAAFYEISVVDKSNPTVALDPTALGVGDYEVTLSRFGCEEVVDVEILIIERAPLDFDFDGATLLTVTSSGASYQWFLDGVLLDGLDSQSIEVTTSGSYSVIITEESGCVLTSDPVEIVVNSIPVIKSIQAWDIVPNPVEEKLSMSLEVVKSQVYDLTIHDAAGKLMYTREVAVDGSDTFKIDMSSYANGVYLMMLSDGKSTQTKKVVKQ